MMSDLIQRVLFHCGYQGEPTEDNLIECFLDYVDSGAFRDMDLDEAREMLNDGDLTIKMICYNLLNVR